VCLVAPRAVARPRTLAAAALAKTSLSPEIQAELEATRVEIEGAYRDYLVTLHQTLKLQASALDRIQHTLALLVEHAAPELRGRVPGLRLAQPGEAPDVATVSVGVADPIGQGYALGQKELAVALRCTQTDVSNLLKAFPLKGNPEYAVIVRRGKQREIVNYHPRAVERLVALLESPPSSGMSTAVKKVIQRIQKRRGLGA